MVAVILRGFIEVTGMFTTLTAFVMIINAKYSESEVVKPYFLPGYLIIFTHLFGFKYYRVNWLRSKQKL
jgi:hypothetical protein